MDPNNQTSVSSTPAGKGFEDVAAYITDAWQRSILFADALRRRGNTYIEHLKNGQPPVLVFKYEMILDGREFKRPVNYALVRIVERRAKKRTPEEREALRRKELKGKFERPKRPIVIIDPRAGHGPGIGGSKRNSEIGMALENGYPVYFILFYTEPMPGQTLSDVEEAEARFIEEIIKLHPYADAPVIIGNCQAGWAAALLCADRPDITLTGRVPDVRPYIAGAAVYVVPLRIGGGQPDERTLALTGNVPLSVRVDRVG